MRYLLITLIFISTHTLAQNSDWVPIRIDTTKGNALFYDKLGRIMTVPAISYDTVFAERSDPNVEHKGEHYRIVLDDGFRLNTNLFFIFVPVYHRQNYYYE